jgi:hypothetical protein
MKPTRKYKSILPCLSKHFTDSVCKIWKKPHAGDCADTVGTIANRLEMNDITSDDDHELTGRKLDKTNAGCAI